VENSIDFVARTYHSYIIDFRYTSNEYVDAHNGGTIWRIIHIDRPFCTMCIVINKFNNWPNKWTVQRQHLHLNSHLNLEYKILKMTKCYPDIRYSYSGYL